MTPNGLLEGLKTVLGIDNLSDIEVKYLLRVLTKPELGNSIVLQELIQIMENLGLYEDSDEEERNEGQEEEELKNEDELD